MALQTIPEVTLSSGNAKTMPVLGLGTAADPFPAPEVVVKAVLEAIELGYRMFDTASLYQTEEALGEAISQAVSLGLIKSRDDVFISSKLWCTDNHADCVLPALQKCLKKMKFEYLDQYLIHFPVSMRPGASPFPVNVKDVVPTDIKSVWKAMEECQTLGLTKSIGVSNFSCKKLADLLTFAKIPPAVNQVEMNPAWQQGKLREFCQANGIRIAAFSPIGGPDAFWGTKGVLECNVLMEIAKSKGKSVAQVALRWVYEQGVVIVMKSFNKERLKQNLEIFDWELSDEESKKIAKIPQTRAYPAEMFISETGPIKSVEELWDGEI
ncbi:non-functional NADPH-dependent codeinone reductase 2-like [Heracleum sosnowskyi]|uniref:Non-functional NADPH-dependent codeinone reductase 2-like n=1 Tax=Heracleum sosnowskyi TaxID=360622 RepID=A0AAD8IB49_9APIA|nr:non-functional NADPH-dependent codeinone reductase 2-like [Heracleum sosnowskyi]